LLTRFGVQKQKPGWINIHSSSSADSLKNTHLSSNEVLGKENKKKKGVYSEYLKRKTMIVILVRTLRPYLVVLGTLLWLFTRLLLVPSEEAHQATSLLDYVLRALTTLKESSLHLASKSAWSFGYHPILLWAWYAVEDLLALSLLSTIIRFIYCLWHYTLSEWKEWATDTVFHWTIDHVPGVETKFDQMGKKILLADEGVSKLLGRDVDRTKHLELPERGWEPTKVIQELQPYSDKENEKWAKGKLSGTVYQGDPEHTHLMNETYKLYTWSNPLHFGYWPKLNQCTSEVIAMTGNMLHAPDEPLGTMTSGGTESIFCAIKASLEFYGKRRGITRPELICGTSAHAAVDKACELLGIRQIQIDCSQGNCKLSPEKVKSRVSSNTIMIYASAPTYPQGVVDPIEELSEVALQYNIGLHVDACLGGFVLAFWDDAPKFDFQVPGVTSMSIDTHKYGYAAKGTSVVLYRHKKLRHAQYFCYSKWSGGMYATPTLAGSKAGALEACAWAALMSIGRDGYKERVKQITSAAEKIAKGGSAISGLFLITDKPSMVVCFGAEDDLDIYAICSKMGKKGWTLNELQNPASLHVCVTLNVVSNADVFVRELKEAVDEVQLQSKGKKKGSAGIYGMTGGVPKGPIDAILNEFVDITLAP